MARLAVAYIVKHLLQALSGHLLLWPTAVPLWPLLRPYTWREGGCQFCDPNLVVHNCLHPAEVIDSMNLSHSQRFISLAYPCKHTERFWVKAFGHYVPALVNVIIGQRSSVEIISAHAYYNFALKLPFQTTRARSEGLLKVGGKALLSTSRRV